MNDSRFKLAWVVLVSFLMSVTLLSTVGLAQGDLVANRLEIEDRRNLLAEAETELIEADVTDLIDLRSRVRILLQSAQQAQSPLATGRDGFKLELDAIGPPPEEDQPAEAPELAEERERISAEFAEYDGTLRKVELNIANANRLLETIADARRNLFYDSVFRPGPSPLNPTVIGSALSGFAQGATDSLRWVKREISSRQAAGSLSKDIAIIGASIALALLLFIPVRRRLNRLIIAYMRSRHATSSRRVLVAGVRTFARVLPGIIGGVLVFEALSMTDLIRPGVDGDEAVAGAVWLAFLALLTVDGAARAVFSKSVEGWEITPLIADKASLARLAIIFVTAIIGADAILKAGANLLGSPQETALLQSAVVAGLLAVAIVLFTRKIWTQSLFQSQNLSPESLAEAYRVSPACTRIQVFGIILAIMIIGPTLLGYVAFGYFVSTSAFYLVGLAAAMWCIRGILREAVIVVTNRFAPQISPPNSESDEDEDISPGNQLLFWLLLALDLAILVALIAPAALILGASVTDVRDTAVDAFFGITIGTITISLADILAAITVFLVLLAVTRFIQRTAEKRLFPHIRLDPGVQHSFRTLIGYTGLVIAGLAAIGAIGADLSNLAIVAGALSVGIGFGLQSIVSNFVSGLILLFERPVKVGDWIVVPSGEGFVRRISVRSTEIETFDRSSVIVPNSELVSGTVTNLTLGNKMGRLVVPVGVSYNSDPEQVISVLNGILDEHPKILKNPAPMVAFVGLGDSSLDFEVRGFIRDVQTGVIIRTELRVAIVKHLRAEGIEIPFPQRVVHLEKPE